MRSPRTATKSSPRSPQLEKAHAWQRRPNAAKNKEIKNSFFKKKRERLFIYLFIYLFLWLHCVAWGILVPQPEIEPGPSAVRLQSPSHWTTREFPRKTLNVFKTILVLFCFCLFVSVSHNKKSTGGWLLELVLQFSELFDFLGLFYLYFCLREQNSCYSFTYHVCV